MTPDPNKAYRFTLKYKSLTRVVTPLSDQILVHWELQDDTFFYSQVVGGFKVKGDDFRWLKDIEDDGDICGTILLCVDKRCSKEWEPLVMSKFTVQNCAWNNAKCNVKITPEANGVGDCLIEKKDDILNMIDVVGLIDSADISDVDDGDTLNFDNGRVFIYNSPSLADILVLPVLIGGSTTPDPTVEDVMGAGVINPDEKDFIRITLLGIITKFGAPDWKVFVAWTYRRDLLKDSGDCLPTPPGYTLVSETALSCSFFKKPTSEDQSMNDYFIGECAIPPIALLNTFVIWICVHAGDPDYPNGLFATMVHKDEQIKGGNAYATIPLDEAIQPFLDNCNIEKTVSDFFQINPENPSSINPVTGLTSHTDGMALIPRSNAILANTQNATVANLTWGEIQTGLKEMFMVFWGIDLNGDLRLEHLSFFEQTVIGLNLTIPNNDKFTNEEINYTYKRELLPYIENIFQQEWLNYNWEDRKIKYLDSAGNKLNCVGTSELDHSYGVFSNDLEFFVEYPTDGPRDGWVMVSTETVTGTGRPWIKDFDGLLNGFMSVKRLVENYYNHGRSALIGTIQGFPITFETTVRLKEEPILGVSICCKDDFDPRLNIKTPNGIGRVISAEHDLKTNKLTLKNEY